MSNSKQRLRPCLRSQVVITVAAVTGLLFASAPAAGAQAPTPADIAYGMELYLQKGNCQACHGWAGDGRKVDSQMPDGANLRARTIDRPALLITIKCGRPGADMPAFDRLAYSDGRCFGLKAADLRARQLQLTDPPATLTPNEIELIADFLLAKVIGKGDLNRATCADYWGKDVDACRELVK